MSETNKNCHASETVAFRSITRNYTGVKNDATETLVDNQNRTIETVLRSPQYNSIFEFPNIGNPAMIYIDKSENCAYRWDEANLKYYGIGNDYKKIKIINGGNA